MNTPERLKYKAALVEWIVSQRPSVHAVVAVPPSKERDSLTMSIRRWIARVDRFYLGRNWAKKCRSTVRTSGVVFFESGRATEWPHAHMLIRPPAVISGLRFVLDARHLFAPHPLLRRAYPKPATETGRVWMTLIAPGSSDLRKVSSYVAKDLEWSDAAISSWLPVGSLDRA